MRWELILAVGGRAAADAKGIVKEASEEWAHSGERAGDDAQTWLNRGPHREVADVGKELRAALGEFGDKLDADHRSDAPTVGCQ